MRVLALDHGSARCGAASPIRPARSPRRSARWSGRTRSAGLAAVARLVEEKGAERVVVGLPLTLRGERGRAGRAGADVCRAPRAESLGTGGASRRAPHDATRGANRGTGRCRLARRRPPARELPCSHPGGHPRVSSGPPPVPGGRSPEEREAARREREARRAGRPAPTASAGRAPPAELTQGTAPPATGSPRPTQLTRDGTLDAPREAAPRPRTGAASSRSACSSPSSSASPGSPTRSSSRSRATAGEAVQGDDPAGLEPLADRRRPRAGRASSTTRASSSCAPASAATAATSARAPTSSGRT